jgi:hypothetical protein
MPSDCPVLLRVIRLFPDMLVTLLIKPDTSGSALVFALVARTDRSVEVLMVRAATARVEHDELRVARVGTVVDDAVEVAREAGERTGHLAVQERLGGLVSC